MTTTVFGEVSYNDDVFPNDGKKNNNKKDLFLRLINGDNEIRLVTSPFQYLVHKYKKDGDPGYGQKVGCSAIHGSCQLCDMPDNKAKQRWFYGVIDRKTGAYKILDVSFAVFSNIRKLARNPKWGDPTKYDVNIIVDENGGPTNYYSVQPVPKEPLSAADQKIKDDADLEDLKRRCTPPTVEQVQRRMDKINGVPSTVPATDSSITTKVVAGKSAAPKAAVKSAAKVPAVDMTDDTDLAEEFPSYDGATT
jgi:hypothetical protein